MSPPRFGDPPDRRGFLSHSGHRAAVGTLCHRGHVVFGGRGRRCTGTSTRPRPFPTSFIGLRGGATVAPGMTTACKEDIQHMKPKQRNKYRRLGFTWPEIKKFDRAIGQGETSTALKTTVGET